MQKYKLKAEKRKIFGRQVKNLRREEVLPANIYGKKIKSQALQVRLKDFNDIYQKAGETSIVELAVGSQKRPILIHKVQRDPITDQPIHADFRQVDLKEKILATVPIELANRSPAEKQGLGVVVQQLTEIEVEALPSDLPEKFTVDISCLTEVDQAIHVKELEYDKKKVGIKTEREQIIVRVEPPQKEEEKVEPVVEEEPTEEEKEPLEEEGEKESPEEEEKS